MATVAEIQAQLDPQGTGKKIVIVKKNVRSATADQFYCTGGVGLAGRSRYCATTSTDSAATQAAAITTAMAA